VAPLPLVPFDFRPTTTSNQTIPNVANGRIDIHAALSEARSILEDNQRMTQNVAVVCCGPDSLMDEVKRLSKALTSCSVRFCLIDHRFVM